MSLYSADGRSENLGVHEVKRGFLKNHGLFLYLATSFDALAHLAAPPPPTQTHTQFHRPCYKYTLLHIFAQVLFWAGNQGNHHNFDPSLLPMKF